MLNVWTRIESRILKYIMPYAEAILSDNPIHTEYPVAKRFPEKVDIVVVAQSNGTASVALAMGGKLETT